MICYLDSSVAIQMILDTPERGELIKWFTETPYVWVSSALLKTECLRTLRAAGLPVDYGDDVLKRINLLAITSETHAIAEELEGRIRTLDALHVATALELGGVKRSELVILASHDSQMLNVALSYGLTVTDPVSDVQARK